MNSRLTELLPFPISPQHSFVFVTCVHQVLLISQALPGCAVYLKMEAPYLWNFYLWMSLVCGIFLFGRAVSVEFSYLDVPYLWYFYIWKHLVSGICNETCVRVNYCDILFWQIHESLESDRHGKRQKKNTKRKRSPSPQPEKVKRKR